MKILRTTYLSLGSNQGAKLKNLQKAINLIAEKIGTVSKISSVYKTASWGFKSDDFYNICVELSTNLNPEDLLKAIHKIEVFLGRKPNINTEYKARTIDIDILLFDAEIIFSKELNVPHKEMLHRNFVLIPLAEIAPNLIHPIVKQRMCVLVENCTDNNEIEKTNLNLVRPICISEKYNYIAIEGNIGAGKTTLTNMIAEDFNAKKVLERFADNPFLPKFYQDNERYAFPLEMSFLADRYSQLTDDLAQFDLFKNFIVSDYYIFKSLIFAQVTLQKEEYFLYRKMFDIMYKEITKPDLYIYLYQNTPRLLENIKNRGRDYEQNIAPEYLDKIHKGYNTFIKTEEKLNTLIIDVSNKDFLNNSDDYYAILNTIKSCS
ncbi:MULTISPECIES: 2-amino-4-hydroxy-6-hydroxymethyldihydropteridine diphosphokinase [Flavobacteriaceae]|uniref:2-amino-4-hydroxy-6-hydroxymethyldihydropteridine pyrophosphokinase n=2 Tax=Flavobacteriaceae TaxID=49546 RepID=A0A4Y8AQ44_9FLAO|nr:MULTISPECIES: 2-amino-4-hydroxy-6-hydroxymethyldihydropteridine diphosphokinase [Flavobacteriaceae]TEW72879.1 2-amino-4-hydroxy-6-hydroxymethyldihydropteridine diphosphokinase [Gramella jeungdoensis]GGK48925.1 2-amino-4-hydroxy-6-hydroxymethyldihydropteridine diphosphokinase [Lutibacter litoralis]